MHRHDCNFAALALCLPVGSGTMVHAVMQLEHIGAGFMIGSALAVVLPEGFDALHGAAAASPAHVADTAMDREAESHRELLAADQTVHAHDMHEGMPHWAAGAAVLAGFLVMMSMEAAHHQISHSHDHRAQVHFGQPEACRGTSRAISHFIVLACVITMQVLLLRRMRRAADDAACNPQLTFYCF
jgi:hypothetical protein